RVDTDFPVIMSIRDVAAVVLLYVGKAILPVNQSIMPLMKHTTILPGILATGLLVLLLFKPGMQDKKLGLLGLFIFFSLLIIRVWFSTVGGGLEQYEHRMYTSMAGLFLFLSQLKFNLRSRVVYYPLLVIFLLFCIKTFMRMDVYRDREEFVNTGMR